MKHPGLLFSLASGALFIVGCGASQEFESVPKGLDRSSVPVVSVAVTAQRYEFVPDTVRVHQGTLVKLRITAKDGTHGFKLASFGIDERLEEGVPRDVEIYAARKGAYTFKCSHICGIGHLGMHGVLIVE